MKLLKKNKKKIILILILIPIIILLLNPLRWPTPLIRAYLLIRTPLGTTMEEVIKVVEKEKKWNFRSIWGYSISNEELLNYFNHTYSYRPDDSNKKISVHLGDYYVVFMGSVTASFKFDENEKLVDIVVWKDWDSI